MAVRKAIIPVAGFGTRFLPATKAMPKEMLPVIDKPLAQYVVEEALAAGIEQIIFVTGRGKAAIENHFDHSYELTDMLRRRGKEDMARSIEAIELQAGSFAYVRQKTPAGLGDAILCAENFVGDEQVAVLLPDILLDPSSNCMSRLMQMSDKHGGMAIAVDRKAPETVSSYGIIATDTANDPATTEHVISDMVEKPSVKSAPSNLGITGRYVLPPQIFDFLRAQKVGRDGELQLTDAMVQLLANHPAHAVEFDGPTFDCGSKRGYFEATLHFAKSHPSLAATYEAMMHRALDAKQGSKR